MVNARLIHLPEIVELVSNFFIKNILCHLILYLASINSRHILSIFFQYIGPLILHINTVYEMIKVELSVPIFRKSIHGFKT